jgi:hypothetical protein
MRWERPEAVEMVPTTRGVFFQGTARFAGGRKLLVTSEAVGVIGIKLLHFLFRISLSEEAKICLQSVAN